MDFRTRWGGTNFVPFVLGGLILIVGFIGLTYWGARSNNPEITATGSTTNQEGRVTNPSSAPEPIRAPQPPLGGPAAQPNAGAADTTAGERR